MEIKNKRLVLRGTKRHWDDITTMTIPRTLFYDLTLDLLQMHFILSKTILILPRLIKSLDHEGWAVGVVVCANRYYTASKSAGQY